MEMEKAMTAIQNKGLTGPEFNEALWNAHINADTLAGRAVSMTHGNTAITSKPALLRSQNPLIKMITPLQNFFNNALNRRYRAIFMTKDALMGQSPRGVWTDLRTAAKDMVTYFILPTLIEDMVDPICKEEDSAALCAGKFLAQGVFMPIPIARDIVHAAITGRDPSFGIGWHAFDAVWKLGHEGYKYWNDDDVSYGNILQSLLSVVGVVKGMPLSKPGAWAGYAVKVAAGEEEVPGFHELEDLAKWARILRWGRTEMTKHEEERQRLGGRLGLW